MLIKSLTSYTQPYRFIVYLYLYILLDIFKKLVAFSNTELVAFFPRTLHVESNYEGK